MEKMNIQLTFCLDRNSKTMLILSGVWRETDKKMAGEEGGDGAVENVDQRRNRRELNCVH